MTRNRISEASRYQARPGGISLWAGCGQMSLGRENPTRQRWHGTSILSTTHPAHQFASGGVTAPGVVSWLPTVNGLQVPGLIQEDQRPRRCLQVCRVRVGSRVGNPARWHPFALPVLGFVPYRLRASASAKPRNAGATFAGWPRWTGACPGSKFTQVRVLLPRPAVTLPVLG